MRILVVATKSPWPPRDGGRLALWLTLQALKDAGHELMLVAPADAADAATSAAVIASLKSVCLPHLVPTSRRSWLHAFVAALLHGQALSIARHRLPAVEQMVARCIGDWRPHVLHAEQLQALANCTPAGSAGVPVLLRMQNVESSLWRQVAGSNWHLFPLGIEAVRLRHAERHALRDSARVVALTQRDATLLREIGGDAVQDRLCAIGPAFPAALPAAAPVSGSPALVLGGSGGWLPNRQGLAWFAARVAPLLREALPDLQIHVYGGETIDFPDAIWHTAPEDAREAFPSGAIMALPLHIGSGIRMRILEAWARGLPVVATRTAAAGLDVESGRELMLADAPEEFVQAILHLAGNPSARDALTEAGRAYLRRHHEARSVAAALLTQYSAAVGIHGVA